MSEAGPEAQDGVGAPDGFRRLWTPHRLAYIKERGRERLPALPDPDPARRGRASSSRAARSSTPC